MNLLAIHGSPRKNGYSSTLHSEFIAPFREKNWHVNELPIYELNIKPCVACGLCSKELSCIYDDMDIIYKMILEADFISISSPLYFSSVTGPLKTFFDRLQPIWEQVNRKKISIKLKNGLFISTAGSEYTNMLTGSNMIIKHVFNLLNTKYDESDFIFLKNTDKLRELPVAIKSLVREKGIIHANDIRT